MYQFIVRLINFIGSLLKKKNSTNNMDIPNIFEVTNTTTYIACVGTNGFINGETYATGYFSAAKALLERIVINGGDGQEMDTLVYPILYSFRHGIELSLKHLLRELHTIDTKQFDLSSIQNHNLLNLWKDWEKYVPFDRRIEEASNGLGSIVEQIHKADQSGQEFRYHVDLDEERTLNEHWRVDLVTVIKLLQITEEKFSKLFRMFDYFIEERKMGAFTSKMNRNELRQLSIDLPPYSTWRDNPDFKEIKTRYKTELSIGSKHFSEAIEFIKNHPEFAGNIGIESQPPSLSPDLIKTVAEEHIAYLEHVSWMKPREQAYENLNSKFDLDKKRASILTPTEIGALCGLCDMGRNHAYSETYFQYAKSLTPLDHQDCKMRDFRHFFRKTNFLRSLASGLIKVGCPTLGHEINEMYENYLAKCPKENVTGL